MDAAIIVAAVALYLGAACLLGAFLRRQREAHEARAEGQPKEAPGPLSKNGGPSRVAPTESEEPTEQRKHG